MNILDYIILGITLLSLGLGLWKGFLRQILAIAGIFLVGLGTSVLSPYPDSWLKGAMPDDGTRALVATLITFVVLAIVYSILAKLVSKLINKIPILGWLNRLLGAVFSVAVVYMIFSVVVVIVLNSTAEFMQSWKPTFTESGIVNTIYGGVENPERNFFGNWLFKLFSEKVASMIPAA